MADEGPASRGKPEDGSSTPLAISGADIAAAERWLARVWPAIALGGFSGSSLAIGGVALELLRPGTVVARVVVTAPPLVELARDPAPVGPPPPPPPNDPDLSLFGAELPPAWKEILFLAALALFLGAMAFSFWREKGPAPRARPR